MKNSFNLSIAEPATETSSFSLREKIEKYVGRDVVEYIANYIDLDSELTKYVDTSSRFNIESIRGEVKTLVNIKSINEIRYLNKFFETLNRKLPYDGIFFGHAETLVQRRKRLLNKYPKIISLPYYFLDFVFKRIFPKWSFTKKIYFFLTQGRNRVLSRAEILGRLISCGFDIIDEREINRRLYFVVKKVKEPEYDLKPSYGPLFKMRRVGRNNKIIYVYKMRTMHPYSEYLQEYIYRKYRLKKGGKFENDFRITNWGKVMRKLWLDEVPMIINLFKGELKIVGVRPLSIHYFNLYDKELKEKRLKHKPGLIPPFYADMPTTLEEIMESEKKYLEAYEKNAIITDTRYFFKAWYNILIKRARSG